MEAGPEYSEAGDKHVASLLTCLYPLFVLFICSSATNFAPVTSSQSTLRSLSLNGTSQSLTAPNSASLNLTGAITVEAWIKLNSIGAISDHFCSREAYSQEGTGGGYRLTITDTGKLRLDLFQTHNLFTTAIGTTTVTTGAWHHVAGVFDGSQMRVYVNGVLDGSVSSSERAGLGNRSVLHRTALGLYSPYYFGGLIDEVRVSAVVLYTRKLHRGLGTGLIMCAGYGSSMGRRLTTSPAMATTARYKVRPVIQPTCLRSQTTHHLLLSLIPRTIRPWQRVRTLLSTLLLQTAMAASAKWIFIRERHCWAAIRVRPTPSSGPMFQAGTYSLTAKATDDGSATTTSSAIALTLINPGRHPLTSVERHESIYSLRRIVRVSTSLARSPSKPGSS